MNFILKTFSFYPLNLNFVRVQRETKIFPRSKVLQNIQPPTKTLLERKNILLVKDGILKNINMMKDYTCRYLCFSLDFGMF